MKGYLIYGILCSNGLERNVLPSSRTMTPPSDPAAERTAVAPAATATAELTVPDEFTVKHDAHPGPPAAPL